MRTFKLPPISHPAPLLWGEGIVWLPNRIMHGDQLRTIGERAFYLDLTDHLGYPIHHVVACQDGGTVLHQVGHRPAVAHPLEDFRRDKGHCLRVIELEAALLSSARHIGGGEDQELFDLARSQVHDDFPMALRRRNTTPLDGQILFYDVLGELCYLAVGDNRPLFHHIKRIRQAPSEFEILLD
jgi:hypothetical protein